jgi:hypothetical protein
MEEKQPEMWLQGDQFRRKNRDKIVMGTKTPYPIYSLKLKEILNDEMNRKMAKNDPNLSRFDRRQGTDVMILKIFFAKKLAFLTQNLIMQNFYHNICF